MVRYACTWFGLYLDDKSAHKVLSFHPGKKIPEGGISPTSGDFLKVVKVIKLFLNKGGGDIGM